MTTRKRTADGKMRKSVIVRNPRYRSGFTVSGSSPRYRTHTRRLRSLRGWEFTTDTTTTTGDSPYGNNGTFANISFDFALRNFISSTSGLPIVFDQYRFKKIEVFASTLYMDREPNTSFGPIVIYSSVDLDDVNTINWVAMSQRDNTNVATLRESVPLVKLASWKPKANFVSALGDNPANIIPSSSAWFDMSVTDQSFNGIKIAGFAAVPQNVYFSARATIEFRGKI